MISIYIHIYIYNHQIFSKKHLYDIYHVYIVLIIWVFLKWWYPHFTPQHDPFLVGKTHGPVKLRKPTIFRSCPHMLPTYRSPPIKGTRFHGPGPRICFSTLDSDVVSGSGPDIFELWTLKCPGKRQTKTYVSICFLGDGFKDFYFHLYLGKILILTNIFQLG